MTHHRFQKDFEKGSIEVQFDLTKDSESQKMQVLNIMLHSNKDFEIDLPIHPDIKYNDSDNEYQFYVEFLNSKEEKIYKYYINDMAREIIAEILLVAKQESKHYN